MKTKNGKTNYNNYLDIFITARSFVFAVNDASENQLYLANEIAEFCNNNGKWYLTLSTLEKSQPSISNAMNSIIKR